MNKHHKRMADEVAVQEMDVEILIAELNRRSYLVTPPVHHNKYHYKHAIVREWGRGYCTECNVPVTEEGFTDVNRHTEGKNTKATK